MTMRVVYKFFLQSQPGQFGLAIPRHFEVLKIEAQYDNVVLWALIHPEVQPEPVHFLAVWTGQPFELPAGFNYIGTTSVNNLVVHYFMRRTTNDR